MLDSGPARPLRLIVGDQHFDLSEEAGSRADFLRFKSLLDGRHSLAEICARTGLDRESALGAIDSLRQVGLLRREAPAAFVSAGELRPKLAATLRMWRRQIGFHRLFELLESGDGRIELLRGLFIETYHVVRLASQHIAVAIAHAGDAERMILADYLADEARHAPMLLETCVNLGCTAEEVESAHPTVGTLSLVHMLCEMGRRDTLAYVAGTALFEAVPGDEEEGEAATARLCAAYGLPPHAFEPALRHLRVDAQMEHSALLDLLLDDDAFPLPVRRVHEIVNMLHDLKHAYDQHHDQIVQYYSDISNYVPRPRVDYFSL